MWLRKYGRSPAELDEMTINEVYAVNYANAAVSINKRFAEAQGPRGTVGSPEFSQFASQYGA